MFKINKYIIYIIGMILLSLGIVLAVKSNFGVTVSTCPSYILTQKISRLTFGTWNYLIQGLVFLLMIIVLRRFKNIYLLSFITSVIMGYCIDFMSLILSSLSMLTYSSRILSFTSSIIIISLGLVFFIKSTLPMLPFDMFVREVSTYYNIRIGKFKTIFDICLFSISLLMSIVFFGELRGVYIGTLISALTIGTGVDIFMNIFESNIAVVSNKKLDIQSLK